MRVYAEADKETDLGTEAKPQEPGGNFYNDERPVSNPTPLPCSEPSAMLNALHAGSSQCTAKYANERGNQTHNTGRLWWTMLNFIHSLQMKPKDDMSPVSTSP